MANDNYRIAIRIGVSGTLTNPNGLQINYTDDILTDVVFVARFPRKPGLSEQTVTLKESDSQITVDRIAETITVPFPVSVFGSIDAEPGQQRVGEFTLRSETLPDARQPILSGQITARGALDVG